jgi:hypothetical protein
VEIESTTEDYEGRQLRTSLMLLSYWFCSALSTLQISQRSATPSARLSSKGAAVIVSPTNWLLAKSLV